MNRSTDVGVFGTSAGGGRRQNSNANSNANTNRERTGRGRRLAESGVSDIGERGARITEIGIEEGGIYEARRENDSGEGGRSTDKGGISGTGEVGVPNANRENTGKGKRFYESDVSNSGEKGGSTINGVSNTGAEGKITPRESSSTIERKESITKGISNTDT